MRFLEKNYLDCNTHLYISSSVSYVGKASPLTLALFYVDGLDVDGVDVDGIDVG